MSAIHIKTINGREYAYEIESIWDKEKKKSRKRSKYLGRVIDKENCIYEKRRPDQHQEFQKSLILNFGDTYCIMKTFEKSSYYQLFCSLLPGLSDTLLSLICYKLIKSSAMQYANTWYTGNYASVLFKDADLTSQRVSDFYRLLGCEKVWRKFFKEYLEKTITPQAAVIIDSTGLPNEIDFHLSAWGRHGGKSEMETRLLMVVDKESHMPLYFRYMAGNIVDVSTLVNTVEELRKFDVQTTFALIDAGYFSEDNIVGLFKSNISFLTRLPANRTLFKSLIEDHSINLEIAENMIIYGKRALFVKPIPVDLFGYSAFAYVVCDIRRKGSESTNYMISAKEDGLSVDEINKGLIYKGKLVLISSVKIPAEEIIPLYYTRQSAENIFGISKSALDILPVRVHTIETFRGYLMLNFLTLIVYLELKKHLMAKYTVEGALMEMSNLVCKIFGDSILIQELTKNMKEICSLLHVMVPKSLGV